MSTKPKHITYSDALVKARNYCTFQERCHFEVEEKLKELGLHYDFIPTVCITLSEEGYLNEERFVSAYVRGKFNQNGWGKLKIIQGLKEKRISKKMIETGLKELEDLNYYETLVSILTSKKKTTRSKNKFDLYSKLHRFAISRGFENNLASKALEEIFN
ncbi:MAG: RecX family transcriptional regulator [Bacteroidia bacterium]